MLNDYYNNDFLEACKRFFYGETFETWDNMQEEMKVQEKNPEVTM